MGEVGYQIIKTPFDASGIVYLRWPNLKIADQGKPLILPHYTDRTVQVFGTFGTSGQVDIEGSLEPALDDEAESLELLTNGGFTGSATGWTLGAAWGYNANTVLKNGDGTNTLSQDPGVVTVGKLYRLSYRVTALSVGNFTASLGGVNGTQRTATGKYSDYIVATSAAGVAFTPSNTARFTLDDITLMESVRWFIFDDPNDAALSITAARGEALKQNAYQIRPLVSVGDGNTDLTVYLLCATPR